MDSRGNDGRPRRRRFGNNKAIDPQHKDQMMKVDATFLLDPGRSSAGGPSRAPRQPHLIQRRRIAVCRQTLAREQLTERIMGNAIRPDAELAMLLYIYLAEQNGHEPYLWEVCTATSVPPSTAHRKLGKLADESFLRRSPMAIDRRRIGLALSDTARAKIEQLLDQLSAQAEADTAAGTESG